MRALFLNRVVLKVSQLFMRKLELAATTTAKVNALLKLIPKKNDRAVKSKHLYENSYCTNKSKADSFSWDYYSTNRMYKGN